MYGVIYLLISIFTQEFKNFIFQDGGPSTAILKNIKLRLIKLMYGVILYLLISTFTQEFKNFIFQDSTLYCHLEKFYILIDKINI